jgi:iron complex outermembrane receptor protein
MSLDKQELQAGEVQARGCDAQAPDYNPAACLSFDIDEDEDYDNVSWEANLKYQWTDDLMNYLRVSTGYQSGGYNGRASSLEAAVVPFDEEESLQYELGLKSKLWQQRMIVNLAFFYTETDDLQLPVFPPDSDSPNVGTVVQNAGESDSYGAELEVQALLTPDWETYFNFAWFEGDYDEYVIGADDLDGDGVRETPVDVADVNKFIQQPQYTSGLGTRYVFGDTGFGELWARVDATWRDDNLFAGGGAVQTVNAPELDRESAYARPLNQQDAYWLVDAMVTLELIPLVDEGNLRLSVWGRNLTDEEYRYTSVDLMEFLGLGVTHYGDPRTYGLTLSYNFR